MIDETVQADARVDSGAGLPPEGVATVLQLVRDNAVELLAAFPRQPSALRIQAGGVVVEAEWPAAGAPSGEATSVGPAQVRPAPVSTAPVSPAPVSPAPVGPTGADRPPGGGEQAHAVRAPAVGVFFRSPEPGAAPFVDVGDSVSPGQQVAIIEIMKLMIPVHADIAGTVVEVLKENGDQVEFDEPLFALAPAAALSAVS